MDDTTMKVGLLMESVATQQQQAQAAVERLTSLTSSLDTIVRETIRTAFGEEFQMLGAASQRAAEALHAVRRAASTRVALWSVCVAGGCCAAPLAVSWSVLPSHADLARLRAQREELALAVARLEERGGKIDLRRCGEGRRLCVRVERDAPPYGAQADYLIVKGY